MRRVLLDTSIYIAALRAKAGRALPWGQLAGNASNWLSSVILEELYAGTDAGSGHPVERLERDFDLANRVLVPNLKELGANGEGASSTRGQI